MAAAPQKKAAPPPRPKPAAHTGRKPRKKQTRVPDAEDKELEKLDRKSTRLNSSHPK